MQFISSDSNIWLDFNAIRRLEAPFLLKEIYSFLITRDTLEEELIYPTDLGEKLTGLGLQPVELSKEEFLQAEEYQKNYKALSSYDTYALAIAKSRRMILLSGDGALRKAAGKEGVEVRGTIWIVDRLKEEGCISIPDYRSILQDLLSHCGKDCYLPISEIKDRLKQLNY